MTAVPASAPDSASTSAPASSSAPLTPPLTLRMDVAALEAFLRNAFPFEVHDTLGQVTSLAPGRAQLVLHPEPHMLRPGGIVSGPTQMALVDVAAYAVILAHIGPVAMAVTSSLNMTFLRACEVRDLTADATLLRLGRRLAVVDVRLSQEGGERQVGQATVSYALPG